jgi:hypothetical protein
MNLLMLLAVIFALSLYLRLGGPQRIAAFGSWLVGVGAGALAWQLGHGYVWVIEVLLAAIDPSAVAFTSLVAVGLLFVIMRTAAERGTRFFSWLSDWGHTQETNWRVRRALASLWPLVYTILFGKPSGDFLKAYVSTTTTAG